jgi:hypothetical protein
MAIIVNHWQRRDRTTIEEFGNAAYEFCRNAGAWKGELRAIGHRAPGEH